MKVNKYMVYDALPSHWGDPPGAIARLEESLGYKPGEVNWTVYDKERNVLWATEPLGAYESHDVGGA